MVDVVFAGASRHHLIFPAAQSFKTILPADSNMGIPPRPNLPPFRATCTKNSVVESMYSDTTISEIPYTFANSTNNPALASPYIMLHGHRAQH